MRHDCLIMYCADVDADTTVARKGWLVSAGHLPCTRSPHEKDGRYPKPISAKLLRAVEGQAAAGLSALFPGLRSVTPLSSPLQDSLGPAGGLAAAVLGPRHPVAVLMEEMVEGNMSAGALRQRREQQKLAEVSS